MHFFFGAMLVMSALIRRHRCFFLFTALGLFGFAALRYDFGNDYGNYYRCFLEIRQMGANPFATEVLYTALNRVLPHFYWLVALSSLAFVGGVCALIRKNVLPEWMWLSFAVLLINPYLFLVNLSAIRQSLALVCFLCAVPFAWRRKPLAYCLLMLMACGFHNSSIILLPVYFVANGHPVSRRATVFIALGTAGLLVLAKGLPQMLDATLLALQLTRYRHVLGDGLHNSLRATLLSSVSFFYLLWNMPRLRGRTLVYAKLWLIGSVLSVLAFRVSMLTRLEMYFDIFSIVAFPRMLARPRRDETLPGFLNNVVFPATILLILLLRYDSFFHNPMWERFCTYRTILGA